MFGLFANRREAGGTGKQKGRGSEAPTTIMMICQVSRTNHCNICQGFFADGEDICANGHEVGKQYEKLPRLRC